MMKRLCVLLLTLVLLTSCAMAAWNDARPIGNDRAGYLFPDTAWFDFHASNMTDEDIAALQEACGFDQYGCLDRGLVILTMARIPHAENFGETETDRLLYMMNIDYDNLSAKMIDPQWIGSIEQGLMPGCNVGMLQVFDESPDATEADVVFFYFEAEGDMFHFEFENVYDAETLEDAAKLLSTWQPTLPAE